MNKNKTFATFLAPNKQPDLDKIKYPLLSSTKLDGCRLLIKNGVITTRSLKPLQNKQLNDKFEPLRKRTESGTTLMDGEIYAEGIPFYMITSCFMTQDYTTQNSIDRWQVLCDDYEMDITREEVLDKLKFYMFDCVMDENYNMPFSTRNTWVQLTAKNYPNLIVPVEQKMVHSADEVRTMFRDVLDRGYEGIMLKASEGYYKFGRATLNEALIFKVKPYISFDAQIVRVNQATKVDPAAPKTRNELGRSVTSKKKEERIPIARAKTFTVIYEKECHNCAELKRIGAQGKGCELCNNTGTTKHEVDVAIGMTEEVRNEIWANKESYIGRWIQYKGLVVGSKDVPRSCTMERWREDKDD